MNQFYDKELVLYAAYGLIGFAVFLFARMILAEQESREAQENLEELGQRKASNGLVKITRPFFSHYVVPLLRGKPMWDSRRKHYQRKLVAAGLRDELTPDEAIGFKLFLIVFFPIVGGFLRATDLADVSTLLILGSGVIGWFYPDFWIRGRIQERQKAVLKAMPFVVDLLALSMEAGLDFIGAIGKVVEKGAQSPLIEELGQVLKEIKVGSSRQDALREMSARIDMQEMTSFVAILISADQMGASIGKILRQQSETIRTERILRAEKEGAKASSKLMLPIVLFIVPAVFVIIIGPIILGGGMDGM